VGKSTRFPRMSENQKTAEIFFDKKYPWILLMIFFMAKIASFSKKIYKLKKVEIFFYQKYPWIFSMIFFMGKMQVSQNNSIN
jgi:hypothetical protein